MASKWKVLDSRTVISDPWLNIRADSCLGKNGVLISPYYVIDEKDFVTIVPLTLDSKVVLVKQYRHGVRAILSEFPCGMCEKTDASPADSAARELLEETGFAAEEMVPLGSCYVNPARYTNRVFSFLGLGVKVTGKPSSDATEQISFEMRSLRGLCRELRRPDCCLQAMHLVALFRAMEWLREERPEIVRGLAM